MQPLGLWILLLRPLRRFVLVLSRSCSYDVSLILSIYRVRNERSQLTAGSATFVRAQRIFQHNGINAHLGRWAFGWTWAAWACMFVASLMLCLGCLVGRDRDHASGGGRFGRSRRNRNSVLDSESQRRVKEEY